MANKSDKNSNSANTGPDSKPTEVIPIWNRLERGLDAADHVLASGSDMTLDFANCEFITVDGLEWLEEILLRADSLGSKVTFINLHPTIYKVFKVAHIDSLQKACGAPGPATGPVC